MNTEATRLMYDGRSLGAIWLSFFRCNINMNTEATCLMYDCRSLGVILTRTLKLHV